jgi:hypothetical protein
VRSLKEVLTIRELLPFTRGQRAEDEIVAQRDRQKETHPANMVLMFGLPLLYTSAAVKEKRVQQKECNRHHHRRGISLSSTTSKSPTRPSFLQNCNQ